MSNYRQALERIVEAIEPMERQFANISWLGSIKTIAREALAKVEGK